MSKSLARVVQALRAAGVDATPVETTGEARTAEAHVRQQLSFYMSTPAYRAVLELHGWGDTADQLEAALRKVFPAMLKIDKAAGDIVADDVKTLLTPLGIQSLAVTPA